MGRLVGDFPLNILTQALWRSFQSSHKWSFAYWLVSIRIFTNESRLILYAASAEDAKGCGLAIAYTNDVYSITPETFVVFSTNHTCLWTRHTQFQIPANMPPCPNGKCICSWNWIHGNMDNEGYGNEIYMVSRCFRLRCLWKAFDPIKLPYRTDLTVTLAAPPRMYHSPRLRLPFFAITIAPYASKEPRLVPSFRLFERTIEPNPQCTLL